MKIALLLFGQYRTFETTVKTYNILKHDDVDVFVYSWNKSFDTSIEKNITQEIDVSKQMITKYIPNANIILEDYSNWKTDPCNKYNYAIHYQWKRLYEMILSSKKIYDYVFLCRMDCYFYFHDFINNLKSIKPKTLYLLHNLHKNIDKSNENYNRWFAVDILFLGEYSTILNFLKYLPNIKDPHFDLGDYIKNSKYFSYDSSQFCYSNIVRSNMVSFFNHFFEQNLDNNQNDDFYLFCQSFDKYIQPVLEKEFEKYGKR
jgi:hypothetical protein